MRYVKTKMLSTREVAKEMGFSDRTIARWCREGRFVRRERGKTLPFESGAIKVGRVWRIFDNYEVL